VKASQATAQVFFTAFKAMEDAERDAFIEKIVNDPRFKQDLIDIALIQDAKKVKGRSVSARSYFARRKKEKTS